MSESVVNATASACEGRSWRPVAVKRPVAIQAAIAPRVVIAIRIETETEVIVGLWVPEPEKSRMRRPLRERLVRADTSLPKAGVTTKPGAKAKTARRDAIASVQTTSSAASLRTESLGRIRGVWVARVPTLAAGVGGAWSHGAAVT